MGMQAWCSDSDLEEFQSRFRWIPPEPPKPRKLLPLRVEMTYQEIADELGITKQAVQQAEVKALKKLAAAFPELRDWLPSADLP